MWASDAVAAPRRDDRADIGREPVRVADRQLRQRAPQHGQHPVGHVVLQAQHPQRRTALPGAVEGRHQHVAPPPARPARTSRPPGRSARRSRRSAAPAAVRVSRSASCRCDQPRHIGRPGEHHALTRASAHQPRPDLALRRAAAAATSAGTPASCRIATACAATSGVSSAGFASTVLPAASAAATCPVKIASGKFHGLMHATGRAARCVALESVRAPAPRSSAGSPPPPAPRRSRWTATCRPRARSARAGRHPRFQQVRGAEQARRPLGRRRAGHGAAAAAPPAPRPPRRASAPTTWPTTSRWSAGLRTGCGLPGLPPRLPHAIAPARPAGRREARQRLLVAEVEPGGVRALRPEQVARQGMRSMRRPDRLRRATAATGSATRSSTDTAGSWMRLTKDELAPFSSRRRTR